MKLHPPNKKKKKLHFPVHSFFVHAKKKNNSQTRKLDWKHIGPLKRGKKAKNKKTLTA